MAHCFSLPNVLKKRLQVDSSNESSSNSCEVFPFFKLPVELVAEIIKKYFPVNFKKEILFQIPQFQQHLVEDSLWFPLTENFYKQVNSIKPGWQVISDDLCYLCYYDIDYFQLFIKIYYFNIRNKQARFPVKRDKRRTQQKTTSLKNPRQTFVKDILVYEISGLHHPMYFWIFQSHYIRWPQQVRWTKKRCGTSMNSSGIYKLVHNQCLLYDSDLHSHSLLLTLHVDKSLTLNCVDTECEDSIFFTKIVPLKFQFCKNSSEENIPLECTSCKKDSNLVHPRCIETYEDFNETMVSVTQTDFFCKAEAAISYKEKILSVYGGPS